MCNARLVPSSAQPVAVRFDPLCAAGRLACSGSGELFEGEWWAADLAGVEASDGAVQADGGAFVVEFDDGAVVALEVAGA